MCKQYKIQIEFKHNVFILFQINLQQSSEKLQKSMCKLLFSEAQLLNNY